MLHRALGQRRIASETADLFNRIWKGGTYGGFSRGTPGERKTPFLDDFAERLKSLGGEATRVADLGAGSCDHSFRLAGEGFDVTAVEYSETAIIAAIAHLATCPPMKGRVRLVQSDLFAYARQLAARSLEGVYANSVLHFLSSDERNALYQLLHRAQIENGLLAVSFKNRGDALEKRGRVVEETEAGLIVEGEDEIRRLFVSDPRPREQELQAAGYRLIEIVRWSVPNYNIIGEKGEFVGLIATPRKGDK